MIFLDRFLQGLKPQFDDDVVDRLNYYYTPLIFIIFALTLSAKQYVGQPIQCWIPAQFTGAWEQYSENYCFVQNTYFLPLTHYIPRDVSEREDREIGYYQWVPFVLGIQGILFYLPSLLWRILNWQSGVAVKSIIQMCEDVGNMQIDKRKTSVEVVAIHLRDSLRIQQTLLKWNPISMLTRRGSYLNLLYLLIKIIYVVQCVVQFFILNRFLSTSYTFWGFDVLRDLAYGREWEESGHFPRVTMCDFEVRVLGNKHRHTVQCVLMINMFNEKVYLFVWWWLVIVFIATIASLSYWIIISFSKTQSDSFITQYLKVYGLVPNESRGPVNKFIDSYLKHDGVFILRLIATNAGDLITTDLVYHLWQMFLQEESAKAQTLPMPRAPPAHLDDVDGNNYDEKQRLT